MATKPGNYLGWVPSGSNKYIAQPSSGQQTTGFVGIQPPPAQYLNWLFYYCDQWIQWFDQLTQNLSNITPTSSNTIGTQPSSVYLLNPSGGTFSFTLPAASENSGWKFIIKNVSLGSGNSVSVLPTGSDLIEGGSSATLAPGDVQWWVSDGISNWYLLN